MKEVDSKKGYLVVYSDDYDYLERTYHIERDDDLMLFDSDLEASKKAEMDGLDVVYYNNVGYLRDDNSIYMIEFETKMKEIIKHLEAICELCEDHDISEHLGKHEIFDKPINVGIDSLKSESV